VITDILSEGDFVIGVIWTRELQSNTRWNPSFRSVLFAFLVRKKLLSGKKQNTSITAIATPRNITIVINQIIFRARTHC
jgi:hypothetical protein